MRILLPFLLTLLSISVAARSFQIAKPRCPDECGGIKIPFPFGIGNGCFFNESTFGGLFYNITCNDTMGTPKPIYGTNIPVLSVSLDDHNFRIAARVAYDCYKDNQSTINFKADLTMVEFTASRTQNKFVAIGCDTQAVVQGYRHNEYYYTGCITYCTSMHSIGNGTCSGVGCCENPIPDGITKTEASIGSYYNHSYAPFNPCSAAFVVENGAFNFSTQNLTYSEDFFSDLKLPMVFEWSIINDSCSNTNNLCGVNTRCIDNANDTQGYRCICSNGYQGNPYLPRGCYQDVNECLGGNECQESEYCVNRIGDYVCKCPVGSSGNATKTSPCIPNIATKLSNLPTGVKVAVGLGVGFIILLVGGFMLNMHHRKKKLLELRESFFRKNGGLIMSQKLHGHELSIQKFKNFTIEELEKATNNFSEASVVGKGGFGKVYKGTLENGEVVAIKRSLEVDPKQVDQFITEALLLSEINNKNVVRLLGGCLYTKVPLLVYEFINNGTLHEHLHDEGKAALLTWDIRLSIAESVASVLSYLHTTLTKPIIHRDMKSMNILLDENYTAKVSDFGASTLVPMDHGEFANVVMGTRGYLDPEYMQTGEFTDKSDVYSFGVVLVELLTRKKVLSRDRPEAEISLAAHFLRKLKEDRLFDVIDEEIVLDHNQEQIKEVAELAKWCLYMKGEERPTMKEVESELEAIRRTRRHPFYKVQALPEESEYLLPKTLINFEGSTMLENNSNYY